MKSPRRLELSVVGLMLVIILAALFPALLHARRETRDGIRRAELVAMKGELERYFNEHEQYPLAYEAKPHRFVVVEEKAGGAVSWYLRAELENKGAEIADFDLEHNVFFRVVRENGRTYFDICGGESHCGVER